MTITDEAVEAHARAMCRAMGLDPDRVQMRYNWALEDFFAVPIWRDVEEHARLYLASRAAEKEMEN